MMETSQTQNRSRSQQWFERAQQSLVEGVNSPSRGATVYTAGPIMLERGQGSHVWDADGNEYVDFMMSFGALIQGHAHPALVKTVSNAMAEGSHFAAATSAEVEAAERFRRMVPSAEVVRFTNTGSEATMLALRLARAHTGRTKFLKFEGHYHGWYDDILVASNPLPPGAVGLRSDPVKIADSSGLNRHALEDTIVVPWNDLPSLERAIQNHPGQIAAVITEGVMANMGVIPPDDGYLEGLQKLARHHGILFILDETVTGFRIAPGGCQEYYKLQPDLVSFGKALGCGLPVAAFAGRADVMSELAGGSVLHYGTHNASRIGMFAARASLRKLTRDGGAAFRYIWNLADQLAGGLTELFRRKGVPAIVQRVGPMFQIMFTERESIRDYREFCRYVDRRKYQRLSWKLFEFGVYISPAATLHSIVTVAHTADDVERTLAAMEKALDSLA